jgi:hypothetical protein
VSDEQPSSRRRRRRRATSAQGAPQPRGTTTPLPGPDAAPGATPPGGTPPDPPPAGAPPSGKDRPERTVRRQRANRDPLERGLRDLVGAGRSQLGVDGALRGRDVNRPGDDDLAEAERDLVIVRRHWKPTDKPT